VASNAVRPVVIRGRANYAGGGIVAAVRSDATGFFHGHARPVKMVRVPSHPRGPPMSIRIPFNKPFVAGKELYYIARAVSLGNIGGDGYFTQQCCRLLEQRFGIHRVMMVPSCTAALEMAVMLCDPAPGDEVILPSFTFVSTANAVVRLGAKPVFVDIRPDTLNLDEDLVARAITPRTKVIFPVHYAGVSCEMGRIGALATEYGLRVIEDAAQGVNSWYGDKALGSLGDLGTYSFHETKNYICGEGGALSVNDPALVERAEIIRDKGTNRRQFFRGQVDKYTWVDVGSSYVPSEICCAFLYAQLELMDAITERRKTIFGYYRDHLAPLEEEGLLRLPRVPAGCRTNYHIFYVLLPDAATRDGLMNHLKQKGILAVFHYVPLHSAPMGLKLGYCEGQLPVTEDLSARLLRLPLYHEIAEAEQAEVVREITAYLHGPAPVGSQRTVTVNGVTVGG
jgi:dTDP-4-amino-4,6-dideoxygalactose transaminase